MQLLLSLAAAVSFQQPFQLFLELPHILEVPVHAGKPDVRHRIQSLQMIHNQLADLAGRPLPLLRIHHILLRGVNHDLKLAGGNRPLLAGAHQARQQLMAVEPLATAILLHHHVGDLVDPLIRGEAPLALLALAPPPNGIGFFTLARVNHTVLRKPAVRTFHFNSILVDRREVLSSAKRPTRRKRSTAGLQLQAGCALRAVYWMVYAAVVTALLRYPVAAANALIVSLADTWIGPL